MKKILLFLTCVIFIYACGSNKTEKIKTYTFTRIKNIELPIPDNLYKSPILYKFTKKDSSYYFFYFSHSHLFIYNLDEQKLISDLFLPKTLLVEVVNLDSIFLLQKNAYYSYSEKDSMLLLIDGTGNIKNNYSLKNAPVNGGMFCSIDSASYIYNLYYYRNKLYLFFSKIIFNTLEDSLLLSVNNPILGHIDLTDNVFYSDSFLKYTDLPEYNIDKSYSHFSMTGNQNDLFFTFRYSPIILKYNMKSKQLDTFKIYSYRKNDFKILASDKFGYNSGHLFFTFNPQTNEYISYYLLGDLFSGTKFNCVILDSNLNRIGEYYSKKIINNNNYLEGYFYFFDDKATLDANKKIVLSVEKLNHKFIYSDSLQKSYSNEDKKCNIAKENNNIDTFYLQNYIYNKIKKDNFKAIIVPIFLSCHTCVDFLLQTFSMNQELYRTKNVYLIAVGNEYSEIKQKLHNYNIILDNTVIIDSVNKYSIAYDEFGLEHLVIFKNRKIIFSRDYYPDELDSLVLKTLE